MSHIERRANLWYATLTIPKEVRPTLGKAKFIKSLGTPDKKEAAILAAPVIAHWKSLIREARGNEGAVLIEARRWREMFAKASTSVERDVLEDMVRAKAETLLDTHSNEAAQDFYQMAFEGKAESAAHYEQWKTQLQVAPKTRDQYIKDVDLMLSRFNLLEKINKATVKLWVDHLTERGNTANSINRILGSCRGYWKYLAKHGAVPVDSDPFKGHLDPTAKKTKGRKGWVPFTTEEIVLLHTEAIATEDHQLADLILLGAYTGARIEELCSIRLTDVSNDRIKIEDSKTDAGIREVPIHSKLQSVIRRLCSTSSDGYLLPGLTFNKYNDRSNAIGKRFGRLKTKLGHPTPKVFHSIRKTFVTQLENAGIPEGVAADIIGHEKPTLTFGLYSGGNGLPVKQAAIEKVAYPFQAQSLMDETPQTKRQRYRF